MSFWVHKKVPWPLVVMWNGRRIKSSAKSIPAPPAPNINKTALRQVARSCRRKNIQKVFICAAIWAGLLHRGHTPMIKCAPVMASRDTLNAAFGSSSRRARKIDDALVPQDCGFAAAKLHLLHYTLHGMPFFPSLVTGVKLMMQSQSRARRRRSPHHLFFTLSRIYIEIGNPPAAMCVSALLRSSLVWWILNPDTCTPAKLQSRWRIMRGGISGMKSKLQSISESRTNKTVITLLFVLK